MSGVNLSSWAVAHRSLVLYLILALSVAGGVAYVQMGRAEDPTFTIKTMIVTAAWPGATAGEVQKQVAERIEKKLQELPYFDHTRTFCRPGAAAVELYLLDTVPPAKVADLWYQARKKVGDIKATLPEGVQGPYFNDEFGDTYSAVYALTGDGYTPADLKKLAEAARKRLSRLGDAEKVVLVGDRPEKVFVEFSHSKLATLGVTPRQIFDGVARQNAVAPAGSVETPTDRVYLRVDGPLDAAERVRDVPIQSGGKLLRLGDLATVTRGYEDPPAFTVRHNGKPAVEVAVLMRKGANVLELGHQLDAASEGIKAELPVGVEWSTVSFQPRVVEESVGEFQRSFAESLVIVLVVSFLSLGFRSGIVVAISVPLVLAVVFVVMNVAGMNFDRITLGALIVALGLLVDDAIIATEMMVVKMEEGASRVEAATYAWTHTARPMLTGTLITVAGFLPVGFAKSTASEYAGNIFWVVGLSLVVSWFVAVVFTPYLGFRLLPDHKVTPGGHAAQYSGRAFRALRWVVTACARRPYRVVALTLVLFGVGVYGFTHVTQQFFPQSSRPELMVELRLPEGSAFAATEDAVRRLEGELLGDPDVDHVTAYTGQGSVRFFLSLDPDLPNPSFAKVVILTTGPEARERLRTKLLGVFSEGRKFPELRGRVLRLDFGPPVGFPVQFRVSGPDPDKVREYAYKLRDAVRADPAARDVQLDWDERAKSLRFAVDQDRARLLGLTPAAISEGLQTLVSGVPITQYREGIELIDVVARAVPGERLRLDALPDLTLSTESGAAVPLEQVATAVPGFEEPILWRRNRETTITVRADVADGLQPPDVTAKLLPKVKALRAELPPGYRVEVGGSVEESGKANAAIANVGPLVVLAMLTLLMIQLQNFRRVFLVFAIAPLALIGVSGALLAFDAPFGFVALLGLISLAGMDMRNSVILLDQIDTEREAGLTEWQAVIEATVRRSRPVVLTAAAAIFAMVPLTRSVFWGPMAMAIMGGLSLATFLTLVNLPCLYVLVFRVKEEYAEPHRESPPEVVELRPAPEEPKAEAKPGEPARRPSPEGERRPVLALAVQP